MNKIFCDNHIRYIGRFNGDYLPKYYNFNTFEVDIDHLSKFSENIDQICEDLDNNKDLELNVACISTGSTIFTYVVHNSIKITSLKIERLEKLKKLKKMKDKKLKIKPESFIFNPEWRQSYKSLKDFDTNFNDDKEKKDAEKHLKKGIKKLSNLQDKLYASDKYSVLIIFQALDAAGKDGTVKHVMSGVNPQGCQVSSFKSPSAEELDHDYLWRCVKELPERGRIGIFNRSYYEEVLVTRVHPEFLHKQKVPNIPLNSSQDQKFWNQRFEDIRNFEKYLTNNGTIILKFFLNVSKDEQKARLLERINDPEKNWKFSLNDLNERKLWDSYMVAYEDMFKNTSTDYAPWYIMPADNKWYLHTAISEIINDKLKSLDLNYPVINDEQKANLLLAKNILEK